MKMQHRFEPTPDPHGDARGHGHDQIFVPRPVLIGMIALASFAIVSTGVARATHVGVTREELNPAGRHVSFRFSVGADGEAPIVAVRADGQRVPIAATHQDIFPRLILQGFANIRARAGVDPAAPMLLVVGADGERLLVDPATNHSVRLAAFGSENGGAFDAILKGAA